MPLIAYENIKFSPAVLDKINMANTIIKEYQDQGLDLTLRQLYYQFVARALIKNNIREYKNLGTAIANGHKAGLIDWNAIVDRTRFLRQQAHWNGPVDIISACARQFKLNKWEDQDSYVEVWIEKDALIGVIEDVCEQHDVPYLACRGYASDSEIWNAGYNRLRNAIYREKEIHILYLGDHDPSGIDMTRDVQDRLRQYAENELIEVHRLALNMGQVDQYSPPPNPTKLNDPRAGWYTEQFGEECWELDALDPIVIRDLIAAEINVHRDMDVWNETVDLEDTIKRDIHKVATNWDSIIKNLK